MDKSTRACPKVSSVSAAYSELDQEDIQMAGPQEKISKKIISATAESRIWQKQIAMKIKTSSQQGPLIERSINNQVYIFCKNKFLHSRGRNLHKKL